MPENPRTKLTLENCVITIFHPLGIRRFMQGVNENLKLGHIQSQIQLGVADAVDIAKDAFYIIATGEILYTLI